MKSSLALLVLLSVTSFCIANPYPNNLRPQHDIIFCGEKIPVSDDFVAKKLMNVIRKQIPNVNFPKLRNNANKYFGIVEKYLRATGLPEDFKYLAIVESGFTNVVSSAKAAGFWQLMPETAREYGLTVNELNDERTDIYKSTYAACKILADYYNQIAVKHKVYSWVLTAAAYNCGPSRVSKAIRNQGNNYFQMDLNQETANYVYKIIAVKELWEYPEFYMQDFGYNLFSSQSIPVVKEPVLSNVNEADFSSLEMNVDNKSISYPKEVSVKEFTKDDIEKQATVVSLSTGYYSTSILAKIKGKYKDFKDSDLVEFTLVNEFEAGNRVIAADNPISGTGWIIDGRVFIDLGYGHGVIIIGQDGKKGIPLDMLKKNRWVSIIITKDQS